MKKKAIILFIIFIMLLVSVAFVNSYVKALSRQEELQLEKETLEQELKNSEINEKEYNQIYQNIDNRMVNCYNDCEQNENCPIYQENNYCTRQNNHHNSHRNYDCVENCPRQQNCSKGMWCNR